MMECSEHDGKLYSYYGKKVYSNCVIAAIIAKLKDPKNVRIRFHRNRAGRWHCCWYTGTKRHDFHAGYSRANKSYLENILYKGQARVRVKTLLREKA